jgi:hypothetical protein
MENSRYPRVEIPRVEKLGISFKQGVAKISFEVPLPGPELLKLIYMQATARLLTAVIESPQAEMDLILTTVNIKTGEVVKATSEVSDVKD